MLSDRYQNSICKEGYLHKFETIEETQYGFLERCTRCGQQEHFMADVPNHIYLSFHIRSSLQAGEPLYEHEYGKR